MKESRPPKTVEAELWEKLQELAKSSKPSSSSKPKKPKTKSSPKLREAPENSAPAITNHERISCLDKAAYLTRSQAELVAKEWPGLKIYACKYAQHWHLTSKDQ